MFTLSARSIRSVLIWRDERHFIFQAADCGPPAAICWLKRVTVVSVHFPTAVRQAQRLPTVSSKLWYCICLLLPRRQQSFYSTVFSCLKKFKFQYNGLRFEPAHTAARFSLLRSLIKGRENIFHMTRHEQAVVRPTAIIPSPIQTPAADN